MNFRNQILVLGLGTFLCLTGPVFAAPPAEQPSHAIGAESAPAIDVTGKVTVFYEEDFSNQRATLVYELLDSNNRKRYRLNFGDKVPARLKTGDVVRARGKAYGRELILAAAEENSGLEVLAAGGTESGGTTSISTTAPLSNTTGAQQTLVLLANFQNNAIEPWTLNEAYDLVFNNSSQFYQENSQGQTWLTGDVYGWFTLPLSDTVCDMSAAGDAADQAAGNAGIDITAYSRIVYLFPNTVCSFSGMGTVGGSPSRSYIDGAFTIDTVAHELGHNLGLYHSHALDCGDTSLGETCTNSEYGDKLDMMGGAPGHFNAYQKERLGWLNGQTFPPITSVQSTGVYSIEAYETAGSGPKALKIPRGINPDTGNMSWFYVEYRQAIGYDSFLAGRSNRFYRDDVTNGLIVHLVEDGNPNSSNLLHMNIDPAFREIYGYNDWFDPALPVGASYADPVSGVSITADAADGLFATITVELGAAPDCIPADPAVSLSPGQSQAVEPGTSVTYLMTITNRDSAACPSSDYSLSSTLPNGWNGSLSTSSISLAPGASTTTSLNVRSSTSATAGSYSIVATATNSSSAVYSAAAASTYVVSTGAPDSPPVAVDDIAATSENTPVTIAVLANDIDPEGKPLQVTNLGRPSSGTVTVNADNSVTYTPKRRFNGTDVFAYTISDGSKTATAFVTVTVSKQTSDGGSKGGGKGRNK